MSDHAVFLTQALAVAPRVLGLGDRAAQSPSFGCFDRHFWHYRLADFPSARFQYVAHYLALLFTLPGNENRFHASPPVKRWAEAALDFLCREIRSDGSVDEAYPFERGFCGVAFSGYHASEALLLLNRPAPERLLRLASWLSAHENPDVANQEVAAILALRNMEALTADRRFGEISGRRLEKFLWRQNEAGYFEEYRGADTGYSTLTLALLTKLSGTLERDDLRAACTRLGRYLDSQIGSEGRFDVRGTRRRNPLLYPSGFARLGLPNVLSRIIDGLNANSIVSPAWVDDRYVIDLATDYLEVALLFSTSSGSAGAAAAVKAR